MEMMELNVSLFKEKMMSRTPYICLVCVLLSPYLSDYFFLLKHPHL